MKPEIPMEHLLRWRFAQAEAEAPRPPAAAQLLEMTRPWWEVWPERFQGLVARLGQIQLAYGHAMSEVRPSQGGHPVPTLVVRSVEERETSVRILYLCVRDGRLRLRFQLDAAAAQAQASFEVTFVAEHGGNPLLSAPAILSVEGEYRVEGELSPELSQNWSPLKVTDRMPFRLILRPDKSAR